MAFYDGDVRLALDHFVGEFLEDAGFVFAIGMACLTGQASGVLGRVSAIGIAIIIEDGLVHFVVDGCAPDFIKRVPEAHAVGGETAAGNGLFELVSAVPIG